eukprot:snap_masked-scaffold228_size248166-processed-gene-1.1 protein:Tk04322 transcript:snap_masked-scaffold228_size248166-processed-gene-1.1-mRNA-1 annotation:"transmembrane protein c18orf45"
MAEAGLTMARKSSQSLLDSSMSDFGPIITQSPKGSRSSIRLGRLEDRRDQVSPEEEELLAGSEPSDETQSLDEIQLDDYLSHEEADDKDSTTDDDLQPGPKRHNMNRVAALIYFTLLITFNFGNKFVLTVLGFHFPMVFQGWQMLVGFLLYQILRASGSISFASIPIDRVGFISLLPNFLFFTSGIIAGSKALTSIPLVLFLAISNFLPASLYLANVCLGQTSGYGSKSLICAIFILVSALALLVTEPKMSLLESPYFWLCVHILCQLFHTVHGRIADVRFNSVDRQYYSYIFSLIVLAPASFYLNEAFEVLKFAQITQIMFICGSIVSAVSGVLLHLYQSRLKIDANFGKIHHVGIILTALISLIPFEHDFSGYHAPVISLANIMALYFIPSHINPDEEKIAESAGNFDV